MRAQLNRRTEGRDSTKIGETEEERSDRFYMRIWNIINYRIL